MDDTHTTADSDDAGEVIVTGPPDESPASAETLAAMDPAEAPDVAETLAAELAQQLEAAGASPPQPVQLEADFEDPSAATLQ